MINTTRSDPTCTTRYPKSNTRRYPQSNKSLKDLFEETMRNKRKTTRMNWVQKDMDCQDMQIDISIINTGIMMTHIGRIDMKHGRSMASMQSTNVILPATPQRNNK